MEEEMNKKHEQESSETLKNEKSYSQEEVDRIVGERLARERRKAQPEVSREELDAFKKDIAEWREEQRQLKAINERMGQKIRQMKEDRRAFMEEFPDVRYEDLMKDEKFLKFREGKEGSTASQYEAYQAFLGDVKKEAEKKVSDNVSRSTQSGKFKGSKEEDGAGLNDRQKKIAKLAGMSYEEYSSYLKRIS